MGVILEGYCFYQGPNELGYWTYATDFHGNKSGGICNHVSSSANKLDVFPCRLDALLKIKKETKPACQIYSVGLVTVLTRPRLYQTASGRGWTRWNDSDINTASDHAGRIQVEPFLIQLKGGWAKGTELR